MASGIPNMWSFWTPYPKVTLRCTCAVNFWPLTWANATLRLYISIFTYIGIMIEANKCLGK